MNVLSLERFEQLDSARHGVCEFEREDSDRVWVCNGFFGADFLEHDLKFGVGIEKNKEQWSRDN